MKRSLLDTWLSAPDDAFEAFFELAPVFMFSATGDWKIARASQYWCDALGSDQADLPGMSVLSLMTADSRRKAETETLPRFTETRLIEGAEFDFIRRNGSILPVVLSARAQIDASGRVVRVLAIMFDNSEARAAQAALRAAIAEAKEANRAKSRFLAAMSHEIRTPMNAILGFAQLLKLSDLDDRRRTHVEAIQSAGGTLMTLLTDLLDLSQIEAGRMRIAAEEFDLDALLDQLADWWEAGAAEKGLRLRIAKDKGLPRRIVSDKGRLQQVLNNYLGNAVKFTETGRITLGIEEIAQEGARRRIRFEVSDTGPGMTPAQTEQLFKPFVQVGADGSKDRGGWGLGLSICHEIATAMHGTVGVRSELGRGSTFFLEIEVDTLPGSVDPVDPSPQPDLADVEYGTGTGLSILVAEDNPMSRMMMQEMLTELGHKVTTTPDGLAALREIEIRPYDIVFMDVMMPQLDGISATRRIRSGKPPRARTPIIGCSAHTADAASYRAAGMDEFLPKPVDRTRLQDLIRKFTPPAQPQRPSHAR